MLEVLDQMAHRDGAASVASTTTPAHRSLPLAHTPAALRADTPPAAPDPVRAARRLVDSHGRTIRDLRISITDRCNFRCVYYMDPDVRFAPQQELLTVAEIVRLARIAESLGIRKVRLTGGEPTLHPELERIIFGLRRATQLEIALISNASQLNRELLARWKRAGLGRISISIDSLRPDRFARITRSTSTPADVLAGIEASLAVGLTPLKLNAVLIRGFNEDEAGDLAGLARRYGIEVRFIEYMPLDSGHAWDPARVVTAAETRRTIEARFPLVATGKDEASSTAVTFDFADGSPGRIGFIAPVSNPFCGACSRLRLTADGKVRPCLFSTTEWDIRPLLRFEACNGPAVDEALANFLIDATWTKQAGHGIASANFHQPERPMSAIGG